jgi:cytoskeletal protein CcmA (bactofilin family)
MPRRPKLTRRGFWVTVEAVAGRQTLIPHGTHISGRIESDGDVLLLGRVEGSIRADGLVSVGSAGVAVAEITATRVDVLGVVIGNIIAEQRIDVRDQARVVGDLRAPEIELAASATLEGRVDRFAAPLPATAMPPPPGREVRQTLRNRGPMVRPAFPTVPLTPVGGPHDAAGSAPAPSPSPVPAPEPAATVPPPRGKARPPAAEARDDVVADAAPEPGDVPTAAPPAPRRPPPRSRMVPRRSGRSP